MWEGACSRWPCVSRHMHQLTNRHREQAPSRMGYEDRYEERVRPKRNASRNCVRSEAEIFALAHLSR